MELNIISNVNNISLYVKASNIFSPAEVTIISEYAAYVANVLRSPNVNMHYTKEFVLWVDPILNFLLDRNHAFPVKPNMMHYTCDSLDDLLNANVEKLARVDINAASLSLNLLGIHSDKEVDALGVIRRIAFLDAITSSLASGTGSKGILLKISEGYSASKLEDSIDIVKFIIVDALLSNSKYMYSRNEDAFSSKFNKTSIGIVMDIGRYKARDTTPVVVSYNIHDVPVLPTSDKAKKRGTYNRHSC